jgi:RNA polymerase sigma-70 factor (ECF subfamily)
MRRRKRQATPVGDETLIGLAGASGAEADPASADPSQVHSLKAAMAQLSEADRRIIHLRHFAELSFKQIAEILDQPLGTVLARQHRALKKLRELMGGDNDEP